MKPRKVIKIEYPKITLKPKDNCFVCDELDLEFQEKKIKISAYIDGTGNVFELDYNLLKRYIE